MSTCAGALTLDGAAGINVAGNGSEIDLTTTDNVEINATTLALKNGNVANGGSITFYEDADSDGDADEKIKIQTPDLDADYTLTLPVDDGDAGFVLKTDGDGVLSWSLDLANNSQGTNTNTFGASSPIDDDDIVMHFNKTSNDGYLRWIQASDYFQIDDDILMESSEKVQFGSTSDYIHVTGSNLTSIAAADYVVDAASEVLSLIHI